MRASVTLIAAIWAAWQSRRQPFFLAYFCTQALAILATEEALAQFGDTSDTYAQVYAITTALILLDIALIASDALAENFRTRYAVALVIVPASVGAAMLIHPAEFKQHLAEVQGAWLYVAGISMLIASLITPRHFRLWFSASLLWMAQAAFLWLYRFHWEQGSWVWAGYWMPAVIGLIGFVAIGWFARQERTVTA